ncbi:malate synthase A [Paenactinomyces guangxiensis]|uniref:Malate synthase n=1 Tax=Paenactinomyces guangxiensis TaxID=1490290 RepID=A0A7W1WSB5_9BACL|nr:malate synthase A [Paenactinomyces guangxiensis]MBA4495135.1 malate synthase A [Paenactinomyces guangxiensis]MBH8592181.1 malate synthase A [Paenactinomyces guangxiensis]
MENKVDLKGIELTASVPAEFAEILTPEALGFVARLSRKFSRTRESLLKKRSERQRDIDAGNLPGFLPETESIRQGDWKIDPVPENLQDRRVEITGPAGNRKMVVNALNSGAKVFMADFEDANSPTWENSVGGQVNLRDAIRRKIDFTTPEGKRYVLKDKVATLVVRPRGWHLEEKHMKVDGKPVPAGLFDFGLYFFHNAQTLLEKGSGPYFYLPKLESHLEARLWNDVFVYAQDTLHIPQGTIKATVLIETILAAFEMDEILYELRRHSAGLNCGRWDYIFSYLKVFRNQPGTILPDRQQVTMTVPMMRAYTLLTIQTCHKRGAHAIGGMAAQIPIKNDPAANEEALRKVRADKEREVTDGHDGTWVAHPGLVPVAMSVFDEKMPGQNQVQLQRNDVRVTAEDLLEVPTGTITEEGLRTNVRVGIQYIEEWLKGNGAVAINHLMEDAATAEISRAQVWQWIRHPKGVLDDGRKVTFALFEQVLEEELNKIRNEIGDERFASGKYQVARKLFLRLIRDEAFVDFLTLPGYNLLD